MNIKVYKLITGEDIAAEVADKLVPNEYVLRNPIQLVAQQTQQGIGVMPIPFPLFSDHTKKMDISVAVDKVVMTYSPNSDIVNMYKQAMAQKSGLVVPQGPKLIIE